MPDFVVQKNYRACSSQRTHGVYVCCATPRRELHGTLLDPSDIGSRRERMGGQFRRTGGRGGSFEVDGVARFGRRGAGALLLRERLQGLARSDRSMSSLAVGRGRSTLLPASLARLWKQWPKAPGRLAIVDEQISDPVLFQTCPGSYWTRSGRSIQQCSSLLWLLFSSQVLLHCSSTVAGAAGAAFGRRCILGCAVALCRRPHTVALCPSISYHASPCRGRHFWL